MRRFAVVIAVMALMAVPSVASAHGPMIEVDLDCDGGIGAVTVEANPVALWVPGHVTSNDGLVTHIVTGIFGEEKGRTNQKLPFGTVECEIVGGDFEFLIGELVYGFFVPRGAA
jgi:hypothetical protein